MLSFELAGGVEAADRFLARLTIPAVAVSLGGAEVSVQGPMPAPIERVRGKWRFQVLARATSRQALGATLKRHMALSEADKLPSGLQVSLDVDPYTFL